MATTEAKSLYAQRKELPEPVFGIIKEQQSGRRLLLRGQENTRSEWLLLAATFNLRTLARVFFRRPELALVGRRYPRMTGLNRTRRIISSTLIPRDTVRLPAFVPLYLHEPFSRQARTCAPTARYNLPAASC